MGESIFSALIALTPRLRAGFGHPSSPRGRPVTPGNRRRAVTDTTCEEKPMASHRPYERLLQQAQRLTQRDEYWAGTTRLARMWVTPTKAPPYRPYMTLWLSQDGKIVASKAHQHPPSADELAAELLQAMRRPALGAGRARRPSRLYLVAYLLAAANVSGPLANRL